MGQHSRRPGLWRALGFLAAESTCWVLIDILGTPGGPQIGPWGLKLSTGSSNWALGYLWELNVTAGKALKHNLYLACSLKKTYMLTTLPRFRPCQEPNARVLQGLSKLKPLYLLCFGWNILKNCWFFNNLLAARRPALYILVKTVVFLMVSPMYTVGVNPLHSKNYWKKQWF